VLGTNVTAPSPLIDESTLTVLSNCDYNSGAGRAKNRYDFVVQYKYTEGSLTHRADGNFVTNQP